MATAYDGRHGNEVSIGRALSGGFGTIGSNPLATLGIAFLFGALPSLAINYLSQQIRPAMIEKLGFGATIGLAIVGFVLAIIFATITQGALVRATVAHSEGRRASFGESVMAGLTIVVPLVLLSLLVAIGVGIGFILLLVPGIILYVIWSVASPAMVTERIGVFAAIERSAYLTKGARWKVFGLMALIALFYYTLAGTLGAAAIAAYGGVQGLATAMRDGMPLWYLGMSAIMKTLISAMWGTVQAALYVELRDWKDGPSTDALADVFA